MGISHATHEKRRSFETFIMVISGVVMLIDSAFIIAQEGATDLQKFVFASSLIAFLSAAGSNQINSLRCEEKSNH